MSINKLKSIVRRGTMLGAAFAVVAATFVPAASTFADALNPLTERSLTLSSSSPGWENQDGSGNSTYAPPNSGANGQKSGNYFSFKVSTNTATGTDKIKAMSFQYCTESAGNCAAPGNNVNHTTGDTATTSDLRVTYPSAAEVASGDFATVIDSGTGFVKAVPGYTNNNPKYQSVGGNSTGSNGVGDPAEAAKAVAGNFIVMTKQAGVWTYSPDWTATAVNQEEGSSNLTGQANTILLQNSTSPLGLTAGTEVKVLFFATATNFITNPGEGAFFVKINTFKNFTPLSAVPGSENTLADNIASGDVIDGGVTVANVMNQSIQITTKVLETMQFSVGTVDPDTLTSGPSGQFKDTTLGVSKSRTTHAPCDIIQTALVDGQPQNVLQLGNQSTESSLSTEHTYATHSYWRLSSNSSAGATVYYSGHTLSNTSGDEINPVNSGNGVKASSAPGSEQFGLALSTKDLSASTDNFNKANYAVDYSVDRAANKNYENAADTNDTVSVTGVDISQLTDIGATNAGSGDYTGLNASYHTPRLDPLTPAVNYTSGAGKINSDGQAGVTNTGNAEFAFDRLSDTVPTPIASEATQVVDCVTAKMRYIANIAATTPAGIYTTKINYIAAPQY